jgi:hypothetical protein
MKPITKKQARAVLSKLGFIPARSREPHTSDGRVSVSIWRADTRHRGLDRASVCALQGAPITDAYRLAKKLCAELGIAAHAHGGLVGMALDPDGSIGWLSCGFRGPKSPLP